MRKNSSVYSIDFSMEELILIYGRFKRELKTMQTQKVISVSKSEINFYKKLLDKIETAIPSISKLPI